MIIELFMCQLNKLKYNLFTHEQEQDSLIQLIIIELSFKPLMN